MIRFADSLECRGRRGERRGAITVLVAFTLPMLLILACFAMNLAYIQQTREELRIACDSAAKAALVNFGATESQSSAVAFGTTVSNQNLVGGQALNLATSNFTFGNAAANSGGTYIFTPNGSPMNSVQVIGSANRAYFLAPFTPATSFSISETSLTTRISHDICLVLDRSASMSFDLSGSEFVYPNVSPYNTQALIQNYFTAPSPTLSRWAALTTAVNDFIAVLNARNLDVHLSLVTYSETFSLGSFTATEANLDVPLTSNYNLTPTAMNAYGSNPLLGDTNISAGLALAQSELTGSLARTTADRTIILMTDGVPTTGNTNIPPITLGYAQSNHIITHVITFSAEAISGSYGTAMQQAATNGNGMYFNAPSASQLSTAFTTIADSLPAVLIK